MAVGLELTSERANSHADKLQWQRQGMGQAETAVASRTALLKSPWQCTCKVLCQAYTQCRVACMRAAAAATATTEAAATTTTATTSTRRQHKSKTAMALDARLCGPG